MQDKILIIVKPGALSHQVLVCGHPLRNVTFGRRVVIGGL